MQHPSDDDLALLAIGEQAPEVDRHVQGCAVCRTEVQALTATVTTARSAELAVLPPPPPAVWDRVSQELGLRAEPRPAADAPPRRRRRTAAAALVCAAAAAALVAVARVPDGSPSGTGSLTALGGAQASGRVTVTEGAGRRVLLVDTRGLPPLRQGAYEVWLLDLDSGPDPGRPVDLGPLDPQGRAWLTLPTGVDLADYPLVDVSIEPDDGDPGHSDDSVLRGDVPT